METKLSKEDRKLCRDLIDKGLENEFAANLEKAHAILADWKNKKTSNREAYHSLYTMITESRKDLAFRYDRVTGSTYTITVAAILKDGLISQTDIEGFSEEIKKELQNYLDNWKTV